LSSAGIKVLFFFRRDMAVFARCDEFCGLNLSFCMICAETFVFPLSTCTFLLCFTLFTLSLHSFMRSSRAEWLIDRRSEEDDRQVATCPQLGSTNRLEHSQVRPGTRSFPAKSATLAGCCRPGSVQTLRPGVQMSAQDAS